MVNMQCIFCVFFMMLCWYTHRMKEEFQVIWTANGIHDNVLKFSPPMVFSQSNAEYLLASLDKILCSAAA